MRTLIVGGAPGPASGWCGTIGLPQEGRPWTELLRDHGDALLAFWACPGDHPAPGGEDYVAFEGRVWAAFGDLSGEARGQRWLVVCHGGPIRVILRRILDLPVDRLLHTYRSPGRSLAPWA